MDMVEIVRYFGALALVLGLVGAAGIAMKKFGGGALPGGKNRRLQVVESLGLGARHRLYLVRCDGNEHLVVLGPQGAIALGDGKEAAKFRLQEVGT
jgi:flagellar protein FliO/FliZ